MHQEVGHPLSFAIDLPLFEDGGELVPGEPVPTLERRGDHLLCWGERACVEAELPVAARVPPLHARAAQRQEPPDVVPRDEVPGRPEQVRPHDRAVGERPVHVGLAQTFRPLPDRPHRRAVLLGLHREVPPDGVVRGRESVTGQP